jgi:isopentenyldiphosphate isomerase
MTSAVSSSSCRSAVGEVSEEYFDLLDCVGRPSGVRKRRSSVHRDGDWHRAIHIWLIHLDRRQILIQLRAPCKDSWAGHWDVGCAGHLSAGETSETAAHAELEEELGISLSRVTPSSDASNTEGRLMFVDTLPRQVISQGGRFIDREVVDIYLLSGRYEIDAMRLQADEVEAVRYIDVDDYVDRLERGEDGFVPFPDLPVYKQRVFDVIKRRMEAAANAKK